MGPNPDPDYRVLRPLPDSTVLFCDSNGPQIIVAPQLLKPKGRMGRIGSEQSIRPARARPCSCIEGLVAAPKAWTRSRLHRRSKSIGSSGSLADSRTNASNFGRRFGSEIICSHRSSSARESRKRANSASAVRFSGERDSQMSAISLVSELMRVINHPDNATNAQQFLRPCSRD